MMHTERRWGSRVLYMSSRLRYPRPRCSCVRQHHGIHLPMPYLSGRNGVRGPSKQACSVAPRILRTRRPKRACPPSANRDQTVNHTTPRNHAPPSHGTSVRNLSRSPRISRLGVSHPGWCTAQRVRRGSSAAVVSSLRGLGKQLLPHDGSRPGSSARSPHRPWYDGNGGRP